ncbi:unnamed protein product [Orchesella dallaii]|uniref:C2H2-type domain-containing protein n=1 Tax=Orchesella dallaii TaxID=48710 RepID=A0ABP1RHK8_9HEXA
MSTPNQICFLCLKQFAQEVKEKLLSNRRSSLFLQFTTFVSNYLRINVDNYRDLNDGNNSAIAAVGVDAFCEVCSKRVSHLCELYNELCSAELRLSAKLEEFGIIINNSSGLIVTERDDKGSTSSLLKSLAVQLVLRPETVSELRSSIVSKFIQKSINRDVSKMHEEIDGKDTEIKEEVESLSDQDDDDENEQISSEYECSESAEDNNRITLRARTRLHVKREMDSEDDMPETQIQNELNEDSSSSDQSGGDTDPSWEDDDEFKSNIDDNNKSSYETETDEEEVKAFPQSQSHRKSPRKIKPQPSQRSSNTDDFILSLKNMIACEANECRLYFTSISELNAHLQTHSTTIHSCTECNRGFLNPDLLTLHKLLHSKRVNGTYPCPSRSCSIKLHTAKQLQYHYNIKHGLGLGCFKCPKCELNLASEPALKTHLNKHDEAEDPSLPISEAVHCIAAPPCSICGLQFLRLQNLDEHRKEIHKLGVECPTCNKLYSNRTALSIHRSNHHKDAEEIVCEACGKSFKTKSYLREHIITMHPDLVSRERLHQCSHCLIRFHRKRHRDIHVNKCESNPNHVKIPRPKSKTTRQKKALPKVTPCDVCGKPVKGSKDNMRRHLQTHEQTPIQCQVCGLVIEKSSFRKHMRTHKTLKPSVKLMDIKEERSSARKPKSKAKAKKVLSDPTQKESFICEICGKEFKFKGILTVHLTRHHGIVSTADRKQCHICGNSYTSNGNLTN